METATIDGGALEALWLFVGLTLHAKLCGRGPGAEADAARRSPHVSRRAAGGVPPPALGG